MLFNVYQYDFSGSLYFHWGDFDLGDLLNLALNQGEINLDSVTSLGVFGFGGFGTGGGLGGAGGAANNGTTQPDNHTCGARLAQGVQQRTGTAISNVQYAGSVGGHANYTFDVADPTAFQSVLNQNPAWPLPFGLDTGYRYGTIESTHIHAPLSATGSYSGHTDLFGGHSFLLPLHLIVDVGIGHIPGVNLDFGCTQ